MARGGDGAGDGIDIFLRDGAVDGVEMQVDAVGLLLPADQPALGIECRADDADTRALLDAINDVPTAHRLAAERAFLAGLDGSCRTPIAGLAEIDGDRLLFRGEIIRPDGSECLTVRRSGSIGDGAEMGADAARELRARGGLNFFQV